MKRSPLGSVMFQTGCMATLSKVNKCSTAGKALENNPSSTIDNTDLFANVVRYHDSYTKIHSNMAVAEAFDASYTDGVSE